MGNLEVDNFRAEYLGGRYALIHISFKCKKQMNNILTGMIGTILVYLNLTQILKKSSIDFNLVMSPTNIIIFLGDGNAGVPPGKDQND